MIALEKTLSSRYPAWFVGHRARISRPLIKTLEKFSKFDEINAFLKTNAHLTGFSFIEAALASRQARSQEASDAQAAPMAHKAAA